MQASMKQQLAELIEAYAAARVSGNGTLMNYATQQLNAFLGKIEVSESAPALTEESSDD